MTYSEGTLVLLETLRWGLYNSGSRLWGSRSDGKAYTLSLTTSEGRRYSGLVTDNPIDNAIKSPFESIVPATLRNKISASSLPFGLLPIAETSFRKSRCNGYNENGRLVVTVDRILIEASQSMLIEVFGDDESIVDAIAGQILRSQSTHEVTLEKTVEIVSEIAKRRPQDFSTSFEIGSKKKLNDALFDLLKRSMPSLKLAYDAVLYGVDEESLHDLRVIARSIKSIFSAASRYASSDEVTAFLESVSNLISVTTSHRDVDVAIEYLGQFPQFEGACNVLEEKRRNLTATFLSDLEAAFESVKSSWKVAAARLVVTSSRDAISVEDFYTLEAKRIHNKIVTAIERSSKGSTLSIVELHTLRKRFKKLRYLTETFHRDSSADPLAVTSKAFQTALGLLQDCQVLLDLLLDVEESAGPWGQSVEAAILHSQERLEEAKTASLAKLNQLIEPPSPSPAKSAKGSQGKSDSKRTRKNK